MSKYPSTTVVPSSVREILDYRRVQKVIGNFRSDGPTKYKKVFAVLRENLIETLLPSWRKG